MPEHDQATESHRPALERLTLDVGETRQQLLDGFNSRTAVLRWHRRASIRTLGELPGELFDALPRQFRLDRDEQPTLLGAMLTGEARRCDLDADVAAQLRERFWSRYLIDAYDRAFRKLRKDTGEYFDRAEGTTPSGHDPRVQAYVAMRPAVDELERYQREALEAVLVGFDDAAEILAWTDTIEQATHGELGEEIVQRCYEERSTRRMLTGAVENASSARELFAATYLLPAMNHGVRDLAGRTGETPADGSPRAEGTHL